MVPIPVAAVLEAPPPAFAIASLPACPAGQLSLALEGEDGAAGHRGTLVVLRNVGSRPCRVPGLPRVTFAGPDGGALPIRFRAPAGMHPGPAVPPVAVAPGAEVTATLSWVAPGPYDPGRCFSPASIAVSVEGGAVRSPFDLGPMCGPPGRPAAFELTPLRADARVKP